MVGLLIKILVNDYKNIRDERVRRGCGIVCSWSSIIFNILLCCIKVFAGIMSGSVAITTDAVNNLTDAGSSFINIIGFKMSGRKPDTEHPFGHGRLEYIVGMIISILIVVCGVELGKASVTKIIDPRDIYTAKAVFIILVISIFIKIYMFTYNKKYGELTDSPILKASSADCFMDVIATTSVLISVVIYEFSGINIDGWCGLIVSVIIIYSGISSVKDTIDPLLGCKPDPKYVELIEKYVLAQKDVLGMHDLIIHNYGPGRNIISLHVEVSATSNIVEAHDVIDNIERKLKEVLNCDCVIHMDPIVVDDSITGRMRDFIRIIVTNVDPRLKIDDFRMVQGVTHTNIIFDLIIPNEINVNDDEIVARIKDKVRELPGNHYAIINVEKPFI
ncbi:MAG: cation diffusion facilitator family transporter [Lachnospiraceae bacterium]|nr:cation diffusion facilitator family transporter [Lachnospiraceae bacterium]